MSLLQTGDEAGDGSTLLSPEEEDDLIPSLSTKQELNEWERLNILEAYAWALAPRNIRRFDPLTEPYIRMLHRRMFDQTWKWAGTYRTTEKTSASLSVTERSRLRCCWATRISGSIARALTRMRWPSASITV
jgi:fido (protein-threonine AMPylation protein)